MIVTVDRKWRVRRCEEIQSIQRDTLIAINVQSLPNSEHHVLKDVPLKLT